MVFLFQFNSSGLLNFLILPKIKWFVSHTIFAFLFTFPNDDISCLHSLFVDFFIFIIGLIFWCKLLRILSAIFYISFVSRRLFLNLTVSQSDVNRAKGVEFKLNNIAIFVGHKDVRWLCANDCVFVCTLWKKKFSKYMFPFILP